LGQYGQHLIDHAHKVILWLLKVWIGIELQLAREVACTPTLIE
jgi:hypothetical protein